MAKARFQAAPPAAITPREKAYITALSAFFDPADGLPDEARVFDTAAAQQTEFRNPTSGLSWRTPSKTGKERTEGGYPLGGLPHGRKQTQSPPGVFTEE
jgi:hypothetical protein